MLIFSRGLFIVSVFLVFTNAGWAGACGHVIMLRGEVEVQSSSSASWEKATVGLKVCEGASLRTSSGAKAKIVMPDKNVISIDSQSQMRFEEYEYGAQEKKALLDLVYGLVRSSVKQKYTGEKEFFRVKTKAAVVGVRGTDFITKFDARENSSEVVTFEGSVNVFDYDSKGNIDFNRAVRVNPGFALRVKSGQPARPPERVPVKRLQKLERETRLGGENKNVGDNKQPPPPPQKEGKQNPGDRLSNQEGQRRQPPDNPRERFEEIGKWGRDQQGQKRQPSQPMEQQREKLREHQQRQREMPPPATQPRQQLPPPGGSLPPPPSSTQPPPQPGG